jgi:hypothetical protein
MPMTELRGRYPTAPIVQLRYAWLLPIFWSLMWWAAGGTLCLGLGGGMGDLPIVVLAAMVPLVVTMLALIGTLWCSVATRGLLTHHRFLPHEENTP